MLLDEFEKAAPPVWDLFLQVFDDGRLTDASGHTADFKHAIIILTSNLGAIAHQGGIGFSSGGSAFSSAQVHRAVTESFRPEFVNRLDKVIVFRPLTRELMRDILKKELARVLERRGLRHREWAVEWEASALDFLLERGFTPEMGARPLKRAIDQYLLAPLAATMVEHRFPEGDQFLFVRSDGQAIQVEFVDPDAPTAGEPAPAAPRTGSALTLAGVMLQPSGTSEELELLAGVLESLEAKLGGDELASLRESLTAAMSAADFWSRGERHRTLARYALLDRLESALETARGLDRRLVRSCGASGRYSRDLLARLAGQLWVLREGITDALTNAPVEVDVRIEPAMESGSTLRQGRDWCERLGEMYRAWAKSRRMQLQQESASPAFVVSGFGAARVLLMEAGLHVLEHGDGDVERTVARVRVAETPLGAEGRPPADAVFAAAPVGAASIVRRYRLEPSPLVRDAASGWRTGRVDLVLAASSTSWPNGFVRLGTRRRKRRLRTA